jgi:hypothetical protein
MLLTYVANAQKFVMLVLKNVKNMQSMVWSIVGNVLKPAGDALKNAERWLVQQPDLF